MGVLYAHRACYEHLVLLVGYAHGIFMYLGLYIIAKITDNEIGESIIYGVS